MLIGETIAVAFQSIRANKLRSLLTMLGIVIGVGAVITMVALGSGAQKAVEDQIASLGANTFTIFPGQSFRGGVAQANRVSLTTDDYLAVRRDAKLIKAVVPELQSNMQVKYGNQNLSSPVVGTTANFVEVKNYTLPFGRSFTDGDDASRQRYAVLGADVPEQLGVNAGAMIGQGISLRGIPFEIIGVLSRKGSAGSFQNPDEQIYIPLQTAQYRVLGTDRIPRCRSRWPTACRSSRAWWTWSGSSAASTTSAPAATTTSRSATRRTSSPPGRRRPRPSPSCWRASPR